MGDFGTLVHLADNLYTRYEAQGNPSDLSLCIVHYRSALTLSSSSANFLSSDTQSKLLGNLANALSIRFQRHGDMADLDHSVECHVTALRFRPPGHPGRANTLSNFATALLVRYGKLGMKDDVELAIEHFSTALSILPPDRCLMPLMNYASALFSRFQCTGDISDLNDAIFQYRIVLNSPFAENKSTSYYNLANALLSRFKLQNNPEDLELCIGHSSMSLHCMNTDHPDRFQALSCFAAALAKRFEQRGDMEDLHSAVKNFKSALELRSPQDPQQFTAFYDLADTLMMRYELQSDLSDLELAIEHYRASLVLLPKNYKDEGVFLENLGNALFLRFSKIGGMWDLEEAIQKYFFALEIHSEDFKQRIATLEALGACLDARFERLHDPEDLDTAIDLYNEALSETSEDHPRRSTILKRTTSSLVTRFRFHGRIADMDRSISCCREAVELVPRDHPDRAALYQDLASFLVLRFEETGDEFDLDEACLYCSTCLNVNEASKSSRATCNLLLARILKLRVLPWGAKAIESIFQHLLVAKELYTVDHPLVSDIYAELASTYYLRFLLEEKPSDLQEAFGDHQLSINVAAGSSWPALRASLQWVRSAETYGHRSGIDVYRSALHVLNIHVSSMRSSELRQCLVRRYGANLAYDSVSFALRFQEPLEAIELFEGGRSILLCHLVRGITCLDELRLAGEYGSSLADLCERISFQLEHASRTSKSPKDIRLLLREKDSVTEQIRRVDGFKYFLKFMPFSELEKVTLNGPVVILNASPHSCDALILLHDATPTHVPFSHITLSDVSHMATRFRELARKPGTGNANDHEALEYLLSDLWEFIVSPVFQRLYPHVRRGSRLWWCPAGPFASIPLHVAGPYRQAEPGLSQVYISSYAPTLQALLDASAGTPHKASRSGRTSIVPGFLKRKKSKPSLASYATPRIVAIGGTEFDETDHALDLLRNRIPPGVSFRRIEGEETTSEAVLAAFREPVWLHLACRTWFDPALPCYSGLETTDGVLSLCDVSSARPQAEFAFLAGRCDWSDDTEVKEVMHLASLLQYSGVRSVIGTLWPVDEEVMQRVADAFYEESILRMAGSVRCTDTAQLLNEALKRIGKEVPLVQKIAFVHVGA